MQARGAKGEEGVAGSYDGMGVPLGSSSTSSVIPEGLSSVGLRSSPFPAGLVYIPSANANRQRGGRGAHEGRRRTELGVLLAFARLVVDPELV